MPRTRNRFERTRQVFRWLQAQYPTPYPTTLSIVQMQSPRNHYHSGVCLMHKRKIQIALNRTMGYVMMTDTLLHEYAHAMVWRHAVVERARESDHDEEWALAYGRLYRDFHEGDGWRDSRDY